MKKNFYQVTVPNDPDALRAYVHECDSAFEAEMDDVVEQVATIRFDRSHVLRKNDHCQKTDAMFGISRTSRSRDFD